MLKRLKLVLLSCLIVAPLFLKANADELKIGFVNIERVMREAPAAIKAGKKMDQAFAKRKQDLQLLADDIKSRESALSKTGLSLSESQRRVKEAEITALSTKFNLRQQEFEEDIKVLQHEETSAILEKANKAIVQIAESEHLDLVLQEAIAVSDRMDITNKVIKKLTGD